MAVTVGTLAVDIVQGTASFTTEPARKEIEQLSGSMKDFSDSTDYSMREARGSLMLMEHELGVRLPREMNTLIATIPGIGLAMESLLPIMGAVFAGKMIYDFYEKWEKANSDLTKSEKDLFTAATTEAAKFLKQQDANIKAAYDLAIASASGNPVMQAKLRVEEALTLGEVNGKNLAQMEDERAVLEGIVKEEEKKAQVIRDAAGRNVRTGQRYSVDTSEEDAHAKKARDKIKELDDLIQAAGAHQTELQARVIGDEAALADTKAKLAKKAAEAEQRAGEKLFDDIQRRRIEYQDAVMEMQAKEQKQEQDLAEDIRKRYEDAANSRMEQAHKEQKEEQALAEAIRKQNEEVANSRLAAAEKITKAETKIRMEIAKTAADSILHNKNMLQAFTQLGDQMLSMAIENMMKQSIAEDKQQVREAGHAAASAFHWVMKEVPFPLDFVLAPIAAATAFAGVMAFESGGEVPGSGAVPILAHSGETVVSKALTDQVKSGGVGGGIHIHMGDVHAVDAGHFEGLMKKHAHLISKHVANELRRRNMN